MTDLTDPVEDLLRRSLAAEVVDVEATPELLARTRRAVARSATSRRRLVLVAAAAAVALVAGTLALLTSGDGDGDAVRIEPAPPARPAPGGDAEGEEAPADPTTDPTGSDAAVAERDRQLMEQLTTGSRPQLVALVREDGTLVTVDLKTGASRQLHTSGDPADGGPPSIDWVDLSPDGRWVYFSTCCEPVGRTYRVPVGGGGVELLWNGSYPRVSPDGRHVALALDGLLQVVRADGTGDPVLLETDGRPTDLMWSPDGTEVAATLRTSDVATTQVAAFRFDGTALTPIEDDLPVATRFPMFETEPGWGWHNVGGEHVDDDRSVSQDVSYDWVIAVDQDGVVTEAHGFTEGVVTPIPGLPEALAADW